MGTKRLIMFVEIKMYMTVAMVFYIAAFLLAKNYRKTHITCAVSGFTIDMYATYLMEAMRVASHLTFSAYPVFLKFHTIVALIAIFAFLIQAALGILRLRKWHIASAKYFFYPTWGISYLSGMYLLYGIYYTQ